MTQIAYVRRFNGTSDEIQLTASDYNGTSVDGITILAIVKILAETAGSHELISLAGGSGGEWAFHTTGDDPGLWMEPADATLNTSYWQAAMGWLLIGVTKTNGTTAPVWHRYRYDTSGWDHTTHGSTLADTTSTPSGAGLWLGTYDGASEWLTMDLACVGVWRGTVLSSGQIETLESDIAAWEALSPTGLWLLDQTSTSVALTDRVGAGDQIAINGTTAVAETGLAFDVGSGAPISGASSTMTLMGVG